jgi:RNA polymerase sigma factor (sigma-70 family)
LVNVARLSNQELVSRLVEAGPEDPAWLEFLSRFERRVRLTIYRTFRIEAEHNPGLDVDWSGEMVSDLAQDVFLRLLESDRKALAQFKGRSEYSIYTYLRAIASNLVHDHFKKLRAQKTPPAATSLHEPVVSRDGPVEGQSVADYLPNEGPGPEHTAQAEELRRRIAAVIQQLGFPKRDRLVFRFYFLEGRTIEEVASCRAVGLSRSGVEKCVRRLRTAVQKELAEET